MKKFLLFLSALFVGVSFATAQETYEISASTGTLNNASGKSSVWTFTKNGELQADLTLTASCNGAVVNSIEKINASDAGLALYGGHNISGVGNCFSVTYTVAVPENSGYKITGYSMNFTGYCSGSVKVENEINSYSQSVKKNVAGNMEASGLDICNFSFTVSDPEGRTTGDDIDIQSFFITLQKEGGEAPVEYTVSAAASVGGTVTVNGGTDAVTTTGEVALVAVPDYGYKFKNWTVGTEEVATTAEYTATVSSDTEFVAVFEKLTDTNDWYESIQKPTFTKLGNTTFVNAATLAGDVNAEVTGIQGGEIANNTVEQKCVTNAIEVAAGAEFNLNITYQLKWGDLAIYQIDNDGATKEYGYYYGSWEPNGSTEKVVQYLAADERLSVSEVVDGACTVTYPITINENHNPGDVIVVRTITGVINNATNSAYEQNIVEGGYVDFLFVVGYSLAVGESGYATLFLDFPAKIPTNVEAYTVTAVNTDNVTLTQVTGVLPANTGVIVKASEGNYTFAYSADKAADVAGNLLEGSVTDKNIEGEAYVLGVVDGEVGLYKALASGTSWKNNANRAYLPASAVSASAALSAGFRFNFGGTTGVEKVEIRKEKEEIYDLTGRRVNEITKAGIYIIGGRKVLVK